MPFPFINRPFPDWVIKKLDDRASNKMQMNYVTPFIFLTSGAKVTGPSEYQGCVISDHFKVDERYQLGKSFIGYDLSGKKIEVTDEVGRKLGPPIIESMEIDTDGGNNTLKQARIEVRIFSQKQLDMFELFFMRAGMNVVLEYGVNNPKTKTKVSGGRSVDLGFFGEIQIPNSFLSGLKSCEDFASKYIFYNNPDPTKWKAARNEYQRILKQTDGDYDFWTGKITNFSTSYEATSNTYKVSLEISTGNELQLWSTVKQNSRKSDDLSEASSEMKYQGKGYESYVRKLCSETGFTKLIEPLLGKEKSWAEKEFFNWGVINKDDSDNQYSKIPYISMKLIIWLLNNCEAWKVSPEKISLSIFGTDKEPIIPITSDKNIISTTDQFLIPGKLPKLIIDKELKNVVANGYQDCLINGKKYHINEKEGKFEIPINPNIKTKDENAYEGVDYVGNLLNLFINYNTFLSAVKDSVTFADFYSKILDVINQNMFGLCKLEMATLISDMPIPQITILDKKLRMPVLKENTIKPYRFRLGPGAKDPKNESIVIEFNFSMEMSNLMQAQAVYQNALNNTKNPPKNITSAPLDDPFRPELENTPNGDGYKTVDVTQKRIAEKQEKWNEQNNKIVKKQTPETLTAKEIEDKQKKLSDTLQQKYVRFKPKPEEKPKDGGWALIFRDNRLAQAFIKKGSPNASVLTYLECSLVIDGLIGLSCGELFQIDAVPEVYNQRGFFQIMNIKQSINQSGWRTTIDGSWRYNAPDPENSTAEAPSVKK